MDLGGWLGMRERPSLGAASMQQQPAAPVGQPSCPMDCPDISGQLGGMTPATAGAADTTASRSIAAMAYFTRDKYPISTK